MPLRSSWLGRKGWSHFADQLFARLVHADDRKPRIVRTMIDLENVLHAEHDLDAGFGRDTPVLLPMGFQLVFFSVLRTVSYESSSSSTSNSTMRSASSLSVQRAYPSGDGPHANAISRASFAPSRRRRSGRGFDFFSRLASKPSSTSCSRARDTLRGTDVECLSDSGIGPSRSVGTLVRLQVDPCSGARKPAASLPRQNSMEPLPLLGRQLDHVSLLMVIPPKTSCSYKVILVFLMCHLNSERPLAWLDLLLNVL